MNKYLKKFLLSLAVIFGVVISFFSIFSFFYSIKLLFDGERELAFFTMMATWYFLLLLSVYLAVLKLAILLTEDEKDEL